MNGEVTVPMGESSSSFVMSRRLWHIGLLFLLLPFFWVLGLGQFIWLPVLFFLFIKTLVFFARRQRSPKLPPVVRPILLFLTIYGVSGFFVIERERLLPFLYGFIQYISVILLFILVVIWAKRKKDLSALSWILFLVAFMATLAGILGIVGLSDRLFFTAPVWYVLPPFLQKSKFVAAISNQYLVKSTPFFLGVQYSRVRSFFVNPNTYAQFLVVAIPLALFLLSSRKLQKQKLVTYLLIVGACLMGVNLLFTNGRTAIFGFLVGGIWWLFSWQRWHLRCRRNLSVSIIGVIAAVVAILIMMAPLQSGIEAVTLGTRAGSIESRWATYARTLESWKERPILGWGTSRIIEDLSFEFEVPIRLKALGSHSTYLGYLYKQGIVGLSVYLWILWSIFREVRISRRLKSVDPEVHRFIGFAAWGFISTAIQGTLNMGDLDLISLHVTWLNWGLIVAASRILRYQERDRKPHLPGSQRFGVSSVLGSGLDI